MLSNVIFPEPESKKRPESRFAIGSMAKIASVAFIFCALFFHAEAYAGIWIKDSGGWRYDNGNGTMMKGEWAWLDGDRDGIAECYYFGTDGYLYTGRTTPDGFWVNGEGAWTEKGIVQEKEVPVGDEYADDGLEKTLYAMVRQSREENRRTFRLEKDFTDFDQFEGNVTIYYDDEGKVEYLTKSCAKNTLPPVRGLDLEINANDEILTLLSSIGYEPEPISHYKTKFPLSDGYYAEYKPDTKFLLISPTAETPRLY